MISRIPATDDATDNERLSHFLSDLQDGLRNRTSPCSTAGRAGLRNMPAASSGRWLQRLAHVPN